MTNDNGGTAVPTDWTLTADGPTPISGATGNRAVTNVAVSPGATPSPSPTARPATAAGAWTCTGGTLTGATVAVALGQNATCTIANNDQPATADAGQDGRQRQTGGTAPCRRPGP